MDGCQYQNGFKSMVSPNEVATISALEVKVLKGIIGYSDHSFAMVMLLFISALSNNFGSEISDENFADDHLTTKTVKFMSPKNLYVYSSYSCNFVYSYIHIYVCVCDLYTYIYS